MRFRREIVEKETDDGHTYDYEQLIVTFETAEDKEAWENLPMSCTAVIIMYNSTITEIGYEK